MMSPAIDGSVVASPRDVALRNAIYLAAGHHAEKPVDLNDQEVLQVITVLSAFHGDLLTGRLTFQTVEQQKE